jgi:hypothetical protein
VMAIRKHKKDFESEYFKTVISDIMLEERRVFIIQDYLSSELVDLLHGALSAAKFTDFAFVSDIRSVMFGEMPSDMDYVWNDALHIYTIKKLRPTASMLKFHPPYFDNKEPFEQLKTSETPVHSKMRKDIDLANRIAGLDMLANYDRGEHLFFEASQIFLQTWAPTHSSETRLIVGADKIDAKFVNYDHAQWDNKFYYFNYMRTYAYFPMFYELIQKSEKNPYDGCFDCMLEMFILGNYLHHIQNPHKEKKGWEMDAGAVGKCIASNSKWLLQLTKLIDKSLLYPSMRSIKCGFHEQLTQPLEGLYAFKAEDNKLVRIDVVNGKQEVVNQNNLELLKLAKNVKSVSPAARDTIQRYLRLEGDKGR